MALLRIVLWNSWYKSVWKGRENLVHAPPDTIFLRHILVSPQWSAACFRHNGFYSFLLPKVTGFKEDAQGMITSPRLLRNVNSSHPVSYYHPEASGSKAGMGRIIFRNVHLGFTSLSIGSEGHLPHLLEAWILLITTWTVLSCPPGCTVSFLEWTLQCYVCILVGKMRTKTSYF